MTDLPIAPIARGRLGLLRSAVFAGCFALSSGAQAEPRHAVQAGLDLGYYAFRDDVLVPLALGGPGLALSPRYFGALGPGLFEGGARAGFAYVLDREGVEGAMGRWGWHGKYLLPVREGRWRILCGPVLASDNEVLVTSDWDDAHEHWIGTNWLGPGVRAWRLLRGSWRVDIAGEVALLGLQSRSPSGRRPKQETFNDVTLPFRDPVREPTFGSIFDWQLVRGSVEFYSTRVRSAVPTGWGVGSEVMFTRATEPALAFAFAASLRASYTWGRE
jgi:hypothetical protein